MSHIPKFYQFNHMKSKQQQKITKVNERSKSYFLFIVKIYFRSN